MKPKETSLQHVNNTMCVSLTDKDSLRQNYIPFIKDFGVFFKTNISQYQLGDELFIHVILPGDEKPLLVSGKIVWVSSENQHDSFSGGVGIQLKDNDAKKVHQTLKKK